MWRRRAWQVSSLSRCLSDIGVENASLLSTPTVTYASDSPTASVLLSIKQMRKRIHAYIHDHHARYVLKYMWLNGETQYDHHIQCPPPVPRSTTWGLYVQAPQQAHIEVPVGGPQWHHCIECAVLSQSGDLGVLVGGVSIYIYIYIYTPPCLSVCLA